ncbi:single-stranded DNA-binding protein [Acidaminococcus intestini]|jgi:single-strand DNA-binding protein|uniref:single-stranded DNA-binding protein n=1 Tax=Acidaminococcus intestini TaxID=187327 RepID=UPI00204BAEE5|nr:single-stranded DNA-binding protein [Acidaminococcus intestini]DAH03736.1 MAG TPA: Single strand binding protein [Caudoviricetes sp.]
MNKIILLGRLVRDPEVRVTPTERTVCTFTLAVDRPFTAKNGQYEADFINIVTWNKTAELCGNSLLKGQRALVEGRLQIRSYDDKDGQKRRLAEVIADRVEFVEFRQKNAQNANAAASGPMDAFGYGGGPVSQPMKPQAPKVEEQNYFDEEIPF